MNDLNQTEAGQIEISGSKIRWSIYFIFPVLGKKRHSYISPSFKYDNLVMLLELFPNGNESDNYGWTSLFVKGVEKGYKFTLGIEDKNGKPYISAEVENEAGISRLLQSSKLFKDKDRIIKLDHSFTVFLNFRPNEVPAQNQEQSIWLEVEPMTVNFAKNEEENNAHRNQSDWSEIQRMSAAFPTNEEEKHRHEDQGNSLAQPIEVISLVSEEKSNAQCQVRNVLRQHTFSQNLLALYGSKKLADAVIQYKEEIFYVHKAILSAGSGVFHEMFKHHLAQKNFIVDIPHCDANCFDVFLRYFYSGKVSKMDRSNVFSLYTAAEKFRMDELKAQCAQYMLQEIDH